MSSMEKLAEKAFEKLVDGLSDPCFEYLKDQFRWQTGMKGKWDRLEENLPKIKAVFSAASQVQIVDQNSALNKWKQQLQKTIEEANVLLDAFKANQPEVQLARNQVTNFVYRNFKKLRVCYQRAVKIDPDLKKLEEVVQKLDKISAEATTFLRLIENMKQELREQQVELRKTRETGCLPRNDLIGRDDDKEKVMQWLKEPSNAETKTWYKNISVLSIVGDSDSGKTTILQHVYQEITVGFDLKMWVCVSSNFDVNKVITDMLESLESPKEKKRPCLRTLVGLQNSLKSEMKSKKFLLVLDGLDEEGDVRKLENVLPSLREGSFGSKILVTTRKDSVASMIAKVIEKEKKIIKITPI